MSVTQATTQDGAAVIKVIPASGPGAAATASLVQRIRGDAPAIEAQTGARILVGGTAASNVDTSRKLSTALPVFLAVITVLALALLTLAFRIILVPVKSGLSARVVSAAALIMFSVFAAFIFGGNVTIKAIGFSLAVGVLLDAFVVGAPAIWACA